MLLIFLKRKFQLFFYLTLDEHLFLNKKEAIKYKAKPQERNKEKTY